MIDPKIQEKVGHWLAGNYDEATKQEIRHMMESQPEALVDAFYKDLEFGTGGLRGIMGAGSNRMNRYTVAAATQGLANYLKKSFPGQAIKVAVAHDSRNNSRLFASVTADVFAANGIEVYLFEALRPTPELSFAIRHLGCKSGVVVTASHNPKEYNGYKAYWQDGGQLVPPHDKSVIQEVSQIRSLDDIRTGGPAHLIHTIGAEIDNAYLDMLMGLVIRKEVIRQQADLKIVFTSIHGTGITLVPEALKRMGFTNVHVVEEQATPDGNFPTVVYPNPEEAEALSMALAKAKALDADILLGTDPDADRVGIAVKNHKGEFQLLNGNQTAALLFNYVITARKEAGLSKPTDFVCKTIVTTELIAEFAAQNGIECFDTLTGFKYIAEVIREHEGKRQFIVGGEESYGYLIGDSVRDKDAVAATALICEMAAYARHQSKTLFDLLVDLYVQYGFYKEGLISITKKGMKGAEEISNMMKALRANPPKTINGSKVTLMKDYLNDRQTDLVSGTSKPLGLPASDVLQFITEDGSKISARPSGTEPKIKFYFGVKEKISSKAEYDAVEAALDQKIRAIIADMKLG